MNKKIVSILFAAGLLCPALIFADCSSKQTAAHNQPTTVDKKTTEVMLKTSDGRTIRVKVEPQDVRDLKPGEKLELFQSVGTLL